MSIPTETKPINDPAIAAEIKTALLLLGMYARSNLLGPVSQSAGVPTGAVIEFGSNANGDYVRFADGTQICKKSMVVTSTGTTWTLPAAFIGIPILASLESDTAEARTVMAEPGTNSCVIRGWSLVTHTWVAANGNMIAFGRWL